MDNWTTPKYDFMQQTIVLGCCQFTRCISLSKEKAKMKKVRPDFLCFGKDLCLTALLYK